MYTKFMPQIYSSSGQKEGKETDEAAQTRASLPLTSGGVFSSFISRPDWVSFEVEEDGEKVLLVLRKHIVTNVPWMLVAIVLVFAPFALLKLPFFDVLPLRFQVVAVVLWYLVTLTFIFEGFLSWFYNIFIVTDKRVIDIDFLSLLHREISQCHYKQIENITLNQGGFMRVIFDYGTVLVQTAAEIENIEFEEVPCPNEVVRVINSLIDKEGSENG